MKTIEQIWKNFSTETGLDTYDNKVAFYSGIAEFMFVLDDFKSMKDLLPYLSEVRSFIHEHRKG